MMTFINSTMSQIYLLTAVFMLASVIGRATDNKRQAEGSNPPATLCGRHLAWSIKRSLRTEGSNGGGDSNDLDKIQGGYPAQPGQIPWLVNIAYLVEEFIIPKCVGVIISKHWILTSWSCAKQTSEHIYSAKVGDIFLYHEDEYERIYTLKRIVHPSGYNMTNDYDVALIQVNGSGIEFNDYVQPICLPVAGETPAVGAEVTLTGWGYHFTTGRTYIPRYLKSFTAAVVSKNNCSTVRGGLNTTRLMCVGSDDNTHRVCGTDNGGPVYYQSEDTYILAGILSTPEYECKDLIQGAAFANISRYTTWITYCINLFSNGTERVLPSRP